MSLWNEFWRSDGRILVGHSINLTHASTLFGVSINLWVCLIVAIVFVMSVALKKEMIENSLTTLLFFWFLLAINQVCYNLLNWIKYGK